MYTLYTVKRWQWWRRLLSLRERERHLLYAGIIDSIRSERVYNVCAYCRQSRVCREDAGDPFIFALRTGIVLVYANDARA